MNILFLSKCRNRSICFNLGQNGIIGALVAVLVILPALGGIAGYRLGAGAADANSMSSTLAKELEAQRNAIKDARKIAEENLNALAMRLGQMQAHVIRLDALGQRLTRIAKLEDGEFDFENPPGQGGPANTIATQPLEITDFVAMLDDLSVKLEDRSQQLDVLETMLINRNAQAELVPSGRPVSGGFISSHFGRRSDPFTGHADYHHGVDLAVKEGAPVLAAAPGVVTFAGQRSGYGNLVEVTHGNGYVTRYGHNKELRVHAGEVVIKGQTIATVGSTGRSTGPHLHFEVLRDGRPVDPRSYLQAAR